MIRCWLVIVCTLGAAGAVPSTVDAGTVKVQSSPTSIIFEAAPGETNDVQLVQVAESSFTVADAGAPLTALAGCVSSDAHTAVCAAEVSTIRVRLRDRDDTASVTAFEVFLDLFGGGGSDRLVVRSVHEPSVMGGGGNDLIQIPHGWADGEAGNDRLEGGPATQTLHGGVGHDTLIGRGGSDELYGGRGRDVLKGGPGIDGLCGRKGDDVLIGGRHQDQIWGHSGDDLILARDRARDWIGGGLGRDRARLDTGLDRARGVEALL